MKLVQADNYKNNISGHAKLDIHVYITVLTT